MRLKLFASGLLIVVMAGPAYPQRKEILQLQADMIDLKNRMNELQTSMDRNDAALKALVEKMADQVNGLAGGIQKIAQAVDTVKGQSDKSSSELRVILTQLNTHVNDLQEGLTAIRSQVGSVSQQVREMKTTAEPLAGPNDIWKGAVVDVLTGNYDLAIGGFREFLSKYPTDPRAGEAQLSIAEALFSQKKYEQALTDYDLFLQKYPGHDKTGTALLKKGLALAEQNQPQLAIATLQQVVKEFPKTSEAETAQSKIKELQAGQRRPR
jgi:tol-pal system protein YbgF